MTARQRWTVIVGFVVLVAAAILLLISFGWSPAQWTAFGTVMYAAVAAIAAVFAGWQILELRRSREEQARPFVVVDIRSSPVWANILNLVVENVGTTLARDVRFEFTPGLATSMKDNDLANSALVREGVRFLPPRHRISVLFDLSHDRRNSGRHMRYQVTVRYRNFRGREQEPLSYVVDLEHLYGPHLVTEYGVHHAATALREIAALLKGSTSGNRIRVAAHDEDAEREREVIEYEMTGHLPTLENSPASAMVMKLGENVFVRTIVRRIRERLSRRAPERRNRDAR